MGKRNKTTNLLECDTSTDVIEDKKTECFRYGADGFGLKRATNVAFECIEKVSAGQHRA